MTSKPTEFDKQFLEALQKDGETRIRMPKSNPNATVGVSPEGLREKIIETELTSCLGTLSSAKQTPEATLLSNVSGTAPHERSVVYNEGKPQRMPHETFPNFNQNSCADPNLQTITNALHEYNRAYEEGKKFYKIQNEISFSANIEQMRGWLAQQPLKPLVPEQIVNPNFDWTLLPISMSDVTYDIYNQTGYDRFAVLLAVLGSVSMALCGRCVVRLPNYGGVWEEPALLYQLIASPSGTRKS